MSEIILYPIGRAVSFYDGAIGYEEDNNRQIEQHMMLAKHLY